MALGQQTVQYLSISVCTSVCKYKRHNNKCEQILKLCAFITTNLWNISLNGYEIVRLKLYIKKKKIICIRKIFIKMIFYYVIRKPKNLKNMIHISLIFTKVVL